MADTVTDLDTALPVLEGVTDGSDGRYMVVRADGKSINVLRHAGHLFVCNDACCCGQVEDGHEPVPVKSFEREWLGRGIRNDVHLTVGGCLGPCALANVVMLLFDQHSVWFHSFHTEEQLTNLFDYIEGMVKAGSYIEPPAALTPYRFTGLDWDQRAAASESARL